MVYRNSATLKGRTSPSRLAEGKSDRLPELAARVGSSQGGCYCCFWYEPGAGVQGRDLHDSYRDSVRWRSSSGRIDHQACTAGREHHGRYKPFRRAWRQNGWSYSRRLFRESPKVGLPIPKSEVNEAYLKETEAPARALRIQLILSGFGAWTISRAHFGPPPKSERTLSSCGSCRPLLLLGASGSSISRVRAVCRQSTRRGMGGDRWPYILWGEPA